MTDPLVREGAMSTLKLPIVGDRILIQHPSPADAVALYEIESDAKTKLAKLQYAALVRENLTDLQGEWQFEVVISAKFWGGKFGEETSKCLISVAFANSEMPALYAVIHPENTFSILMAEKLGFVKDGVQVSLEVGPKHLIYKVALQSALNA